MVLGPSFWRRLAALENVVAIKVAPFNRYRTLDVVRGVVEAGAEDRVTLYTGNDDHILLDLVTPWRLMRGEEAITVRIKGGLLGHWSVWVKRAVELLERAHAAAQAGAIGADFLALDSQITDCNAALSSTWPTTSGAASPAATRCCAARGSCAASGASTRRRG